MTFFNQKEEVIQIELTQYGKYLISRGKWKPAYYAFFDDDVIYDGRYAGVTETNAVSVERIKTTPRVKTQYVFTGIEEQVKKNLELIKENKINFDSALLTPKSDKHYVLSQRIGSSILGDKNAPAFNINLLKGQISSSTIMQTGDMPNLKIPLLELENVSYTLSSQRSNVDSDNINSFNTPVTFEDGTSMYVKDDYLLIDIKEDNVEDLMKNFDIEMFIVETDAETGEENYTQLYFDQAFEDYKNGILLDPEKMSIEDQKYIDDQKIQDQLRAQNYFNITTDYQIDKNLICKLINKMDNKNSSQYDPGFECDDVMSREATVEKDRRLETLYDPSLTEKDIKKC